MRPSWVTIVETQPQHIKKCYAVLTSLTPEQLSVLWNGVGSNEPVARWFKPPQWIQELFAEESKFHDVAYLIGGTNRDREIVDKEFAIRCFQRVYDLSWWKRWRALWWVKTNDDILRNFGSLTFTRRLEPCYNVEQLLKEAEEWK